MRAADMIKQFDNRMFLVSDQFGSQTIRYIEYFEKPNEVLGVRVSSDEDRALVESRQVADESNLKNRTIVRIA
jgi:hypothetical protein